MYTESELRMIGMKCLTDRLDPVDAERFIVSMNRNAGDYTLARRGALDEVPIEDFRKSSSEYMDSHPLPPETVARIESFKSEGDHSRRPPGCRMSE
ncbi:MAG: hypothetical protein IKQ60_08260 [Candidatus Methanomethylophilaceae archaeon]|nr:hypothetical protein [Candidatus Methanomethylophilaceae archaeon]